MNKHSDIPDLIITQNNRLILDQNLINKLQAKPGDRIFIAYASKDGILVPFITINEEGNKLSKNNSISFRGKQREMLGQFGTNFWLIEEDGILYLDGDGFPIYTEIKKAVEAYITKQIIRDINYNITKLTNYEF